MGDAVNPRSQRTARLVFLEAQPKCEVNILKQVLPLIGIRFASSRHPLEGGSVIIDRFLVEILLRTHDSIVVSRSSLLQIEIPGRAPN